MSFSLAPTLIFALLLGSVSALAPERQDGLSMAQDAPAPNATAIDPPTGEAAARKTLPAQRFLEASSLHPGSLSSSSSSSSSSHSMPLMASIPSNLQHGADDVWEPLANAGQHMGKQSILISVGAITLIAVLTFVVFVCLKPEEKIYASGDFYAIGSGPSSEKSSAKLMGGKEVATYGYLDVLLSVIAFMASSAGMAIANKMAVRAMGLPMLLVGIQCAVTLVFLVPVYKTIRLGSLYDKLRWAPVSVAFVGMLATSMMAYKSCSLGTVVVIRMVSPILGLFVELFFNKAKFIASAHTYGSLSVIMVGVVVYASFQKGISGEVEGIVFMILNMLIATGERLAQRYLMAENPVDMSDTGLMFYNNLVCTAAMPLMMMAFNEWPSVPANTSNVTPAGWAFIAWSCLCGALISYTAFRAQRRISATSFLVVVNMNKFVVVLYGILVLHEAYNALAGIGCALALLGGAYYSWDRSQLKKKKKKQVQDVAIDSEEDLIKPSPHHSSVTDATDVASSTVPVDPR